MHFESDQKECHISQYTQKYKVQLPSSFIGQKYKRSMNHGGSQLHLSLAIVWLVNSGTNYNTIKAMTYHLAIQAFMELAILTLTIRRQLLFDMRLLFE